MRPCSVFNRLVSYRVTMFNRLTFRLKDVSAYVVGISALGTVCGALLSHAAVLAGSAVPAFHADLALPERAPSRVDKFLAAQARSPSTLQVPQPRIVLAMSEPDMPLQEYLARMENAEPRRITEPSRQIVVQTGSENVPAKVQRHKVAKRPRPADREGKPATVAATPLAAPAPLIVSSYPRARVPIESARDITHRNLGIRTAASPYGYY